MTIDQETGEIKIPFVRSPYNYDMDAASNESGLSCPEPTKTQQQFAEEVDINTILERFGITGELPQNVAVPMQGDFTEAMNYQQAQNLLIQAREGFMKLPANVRKEFDNDPANLVDFVSDDNNREKAKALGLLVPEKTPPQPVVVKIAPEDPGAK